MDSVLISIHIPKTAGTTFRELLVSHFGDSVCLFYAGLKNCRMEPIDEIMPHTRCIHGHIHARDFDGRFPKVSRLTWLRDPVERIVSEYEHYRRYPNPQDELSCLAARTSLVDFAHHPLMQNTQARVLQGLSIEEFTFVGISEHFDAELKRLAAVTGIHLPPGHRTNVNPTKKSANYQLDVEHRQILHKLSNDDLVLYQEAIDVAGLVR